MIEINRIVDKYNPKKVWLVKYYPCGHYYINQEIAGKKFYSRFTRCSAIMVKNLTNKV